MNYYVVCRNSSVLLSTSGFLAIFTDQRDALEFAKRRVADGESHLRVRELSSGNVVGQAIARRLLNWVRPEDEEETQVDWSATATD